MNIDLIDPVEFDFVNTKLRHFFKNRGMIEVPVQHRLSILAACDDPTTVATFEYGGQVWPLPQTGQMWLEHELLNKYNAAGYFCSSTCYRQELNPKPGRHNLIFPMIEFELPGNMDDLQTFESDMLISLGYKSQPGLHPFPEGNYRDVAMLYSVRELDHEHEEQLYMDFGPVYFLKHSPFTTAPFWNTKADFNNKTVKSIDIVMTGFETISSAERAINPDEMREMFYNINDSMYAKSLVTKFGKDRVERELNSFLENDFRTRCGGGIGVNRLIKSLKLAGILAK